MPPYSLESYRLIIRTALSSGWAFVPFTVRKDDDQRRIYLRHDVDYSLEMALKLAEVNAELGVCGTFFMLLRSQIYNLLSEISMAQVARIHALGQAIGLHASLPSVLKEAGATRRELRDDFEFVRANLSFVSPVFSWHNPSAEGIEQYVNSSEVAGLVNVYAAKFFREMPYYSDSNMRHSVDALVGFVSSRGAPAMQLALHPLYWVAGGSSVAEVFARTWPYIIREREHEVRSNEFYADALPNGMPAEILERFAEEWRRATKGRSE